MSSSSIDLRLIEPPSFQSIESFLRGDWHPIRDGQITYLPLGDDDRFDWASRPECEWDEVLRETRKKWDTGEILGFQLFWKSSDVGGEFLFFPDGLVSMICSINRRVCGTARLTDASWYIERLVNAWNEAGCSVESIQFVEHS